MENCTKTKDEPGEKPYGQRVWNMPKTRKRKLIGQGMPEWVACEGAYSRKAYWRMANAGVVKRALTKERLINWGFYDLAIAYQSMHVNY